MMNRQTTIHAAGKDDLDEIQQLFLETVAVICKNDYSPCQIRVWTSSVENVARWIEKLENQYFLLAKQDNIIVGFASLENQYYFDLLYVHKDFQRSGIASILYEEIEKEAIRKGATKLISDVSITARPFFERKGFKTIIEQQNILQGIEIINFKMVKELK